MLKGVNKQILEVTDTASPYFEKIIFFVRPEGQQLSPAALEEQAAQFSQNAKPPRVRPSRRQRLEKAALTALGLGAGTALSFVLLQLV